MSSLLTVVEHVSVQPQDADMDAYTESTSYDRTLGPEQDFRRRLTAKPEWQPLDTGWIGDAPGLLLLRHSAPRQNTQDRRDKAAVLFSFSQDPDEAWLLYPGESMRGVPRKAGGLYYKTLADDTEVKFLAWLLPN